ncbi:sensor histidine kinase [Yeosuana marina]|uniref:sensor histidine kinase n=1 Tax=Yeosuana marina TaxID=1565536 RepID=UPI0030EE6F03|tara:strand:+ start:129 stop:1259 length:1131 start_codon:yes stop_codon:yes gene_type:complete
MNHNVKDSINFDELKWQFALKNSNIGIWDYDANLNRVFFSEESKRIIGFNTNEFGSNPNDWNDRVHPEDKQKYFKDFEDHLNGLTPFYENEHRILCKDNTYKWVLDKGKIIEKDDEGKPTRIIGIHLDITQQKEDELAKVKSLKLIIEKNNKLNNFAHIVTHNLKSHAANFENLLEFYDEAESDEEKEELITHLKTVSQSLSKTIYNLNEIVSIQNNKSDDVQNLNVYEYINNSLILLEVEITKSNARIINKVDSSIYINFNPAYLESVFQNLLSNAIKYKHPDRDPYIVFNSTVSDNNITITIQDNGIGIDMEKYGKEVFKLYRTFHYNENSEGVGLYLIKNHVETFNGTIEVESKVNEGSTFIIKFPINKKNPV